VDQGGSVPLVHDMMLQLLTGRVCPPLPLPRPATIAVRDRRGEGDARTEGHTVTDWRHGVVVQSFKAMRPCIQEPMSDLA